MAVKKRQLLREVLSIKTPFLRRVFTFLRFVRVSLSVNETVGDVLGVPANVREAFHGPAGKETKGMDWEWDKEGDALKQPVLNPVIAFHEALAANGDEKLCGEANPWRGKKVEVEEAFVFEAHFDERGRMLRNREALGVVNGGWPKPYLIRHVRGTEAYRRRMSEAKSIHDGQPEKSRLSREARALRYKIAKRLSREGFGDDFISGFGPNLMMDPNQYTEFVPTMGGPFFKQLYLYDYLKQHAYAFEAWNHNPLAKRIIQLLGQYSLGRRFTVRVKDKRKERAWDEAEHLHKITKKISEFWTNEANIYGEIFVDTDTFQSVDPSTIWDVITDPDNIDDAYYAYQSYPTAYQQFTGYTVPGEPGSAKVPAQKFILRQIPMSKLLHMKFNCVSNEKRGRSVLFPILGWMKRVKDLYNAQVIRQWLLASFIWDVTIKGNQADVDAYAAAYSGIPMPGSLHVHNENVTRAPMAAVENSGGGGNTSASVADNILSFIATAVGIPKEFFNIANRGGGSRAAALTSAEPFTKVIEDLQSKWEGFIKELFARVMEQAGLEYEPGDVEILFPSVTKDTTTETIKNLQACETQGWIAKRTAAEMAAKELNITEYDFEEEQGKIKQDEIDGFNLVGSVPAVPGGRFGDEPGGGDDGLSDIHGDGKVDLQDDLKNL
jgi:hypothetical protein